MPGLPSTVCETESPTGCTKQLMSVACKSVPAAEFTRPPGMKPRVCASKNACSQRRGHPATNIIDTTFLALGVFLQQHICANWLFYMRKRNIVSLHLHSLVCA